MKNNLRELREIAGLSQAELSQHVSDIRRVSQQQLSIYENEAHPTNISFKHQNNIAYVLSLYLNRRVTVAELMGRREVKYD